MSLDETMTGLMNTARTVSGVNTKLTIDDLTKLLVSPTCRNAVEGNIQFNGNCGNISNDNDSFKFVSTQQADWPIAGAYYYYDKNRFTLGRKYSFNALMRGDFPRLTVGDEVDVPNQFSLKLDESKWQAVSITFTATRDFFMYGSAKVNDWIEVKSYYFAEIGGVINPVLSVFRRPLPSREMEVAA